MPKEIKEKCKDWVKITKQIPTEELKIELSIRKAEKSGVFRSMPQEIKEKIIENWEEKFDKFIRKLLPLDEEHFWHKEEEFEINGYNDEVVIPLKKFIKSLIELK